MGSRKTAMTVGLRGKHEHKHPFGECAINEMGSSGFFAIYELKFFYLLFRQFPRKGCIEFRYATGGE